MPQYWAPRRDVAFVLNELLNVAETLPQRTEDAELSADLIQGVIDEAAKLCEQKLAPINRVGDEIGCRLIDGAVVTPPGFREAYQSFVAGGWIGLSLGPEVGGQGLPETLNIVLHEMIMSSCLSFGDYIGLPQAAAKTIARHAAPDLRALYAPRIATGAWGATMCMTEPACGTDLGLIATSAAPCGDGAYVVSGTKIFISGGDHDLTDNIVHLVLARIPGGPAGVKGLSLFICPKFIPDADGVLGPRNAVRAVRLENKMGYHAISTCEMLFEGARAWLLGEPHRGLAAIFTMVNSARLLVALQGLGASEGAYQGAAAYARERIQGRALSGARAPERKADPIIVHPDVRRMLMGARAFNEAGRALALFVGVQIDIAERHADAQAREAADDLAALLTPVVKATFSDLGFEHANGCMQVFGGHGYIRDNGMEQFVRDCRIAQIQEGANGVQALDLIGRKLMLHDGRLWTRFEAMVRGDIAAAGGRLGDIAALLSVALEALAGATETVLARAKANRDEIGAAGVDYQRAFGLVALGWMWLRIAAVSADKADGDPFYAAKLKLSRYFMVRELPKVEAHLRIALSGADTLMALGDDEF